MPDLERLNRATKLTVERKGDGVCRVSGGKQTHVVKDGRCDCPDHQIRGVQCKHLLAVAIKLGDPDVTAKVKRKAPPVALVDESAGSGWPDLSDERPFDDAELGEELELNPPRPDLIVDAEESVLSAMLMEVVAVADVRALDLRPADFADRGRARIFAALLALEERGVPIDPLTLSAELNGSMQAVGGKDYIGYLIDVVPTAANVKHHAGLVLNNAKRRSLADSLEANARALREGKANAAEVATRLRPALDILATRDAETPRPFPIVRVLEGEAPRPPAVQVEDLILDGDLNLWTGHGGAAKTVLVFRLVIGVVLGRAVFGKLAVHRAGPVLLVVPEDGHPAARMILDAIIEGLGLTAVERARLVEQLHLISDDADVKITTDTRRLGDTARACGAVMVVLDPLSNLLGGASEREEDIATAVNVALRRDVCRGAGATVVLNHHLRKPGKDIGGGESTATVHDARGSGAWANSARMVFGVSKKQNRITMTALKANRLKSDLRHELDLEIVADPDNKAHWLTCRVTDANAGASSDTLTPGIGRALNANEQTVLACLDDEHEPDKRASWSAWREGAGLNENTFRSVKKRLLDAGLVAALATGRKHPNGGADYSYQITSDGRTALKSGWAFQRFNGERVS